MPFILLWEEGFTLSEIYQEHSRLATLRRAVCLWLEGKFLEEGRNPAEAAGGIQVFRGFFDQFAMMTAEVASVEERDEKEGIQMLAESTDPATLFTVAADAGLGGRPPS